MFGVTYQTYRLQQNHRYHDKYIGTNKSQIRSFRTRFLPAHILWQNHENMHRNHDSESTEAERSIRPGHSNENWHVERFGIHVSVLDASSLKSKAFHWDMQVKFCSQILHTCHVCMREVTFECRHLSNYPLCYVSHNAAQDCEATENSNVTSGLFSLLYCKTNIVLESNYPIKASYHSEVVLLQDEKIWSGCQYPYGCGCVSRYRLTSKHSDASQTSQTCGFAKRCPMLHLKAAFKAPCSCVHCGIEPVNDNILHSCLNQWCKTLLFEYVLVVWYTFTDRFAASDNPKRDTIQAYNLAFENWNQAASFLKRCLIKIIGNAFEFHLNLLRNKYRMTDEYSNPLTFTRWLKVLNTHTLWCRSSMCALRHTQRDVYVLWNFVVGWRTFQTPFNKKEIVSE